MTIRLSWFLRFMFLAVLLVVGCASQSRRAVAMSQTDAGSFERSVGGLTSRSDQLMGHIPALSEQRRSEFQLVQSTDWDLQWCIDESRQPVVSGMKYSDAKNIFMEAGVYTPNDFDGVKFGYCLPITPNTNAQTWCDTPIFVFFRPDLSRDEMLSAFAHEMAHVLQFRLWKNAGYSCFGSDPEISALREEAALSAEEHAMEILFRGRRVYFRNLCRKPLSLFVVVQPLPWAPWRDIGGWEVPAQSYTTLFDDDEPLRTTNRNIWFYAETLDRQRVWSGSLTRTYQGRKYGVMKAPTFVTGPRDTVDGAFEFAVTCP